MFTSTIDHKFTAAFQAALPLHYSGYRSASYSLAVWLSAI